MYTLGINAVFHDSSATLVKDGIVIAAAEEERFTHIKHGKRPTPFSTYELPYHAINFCLESADISLKDIGQFAYSFDPYMLLGKHTQDATITLPLEPSAHDTPKEWTSSWDPLFLSYVVNAPRQLVSGAPHHIRKRFLNTPLPTKNWHFVEHHVAHAASAFHPSPFAEAAVLTMDGRGEKATTTYNIGQGDSLHRIGQVNFPHSLGLLYERVTEYLGFLHSSDEYKVMALASYGKPVFANEFRSMIHVGKDGQYTIDPLRLEERFGPTRQKGDDFTQHHFNIAHSLQIILEETVLQLVDWLYKETKQDNLCMAGGVALNCVMNARIRDKGPFKNIWVQPASGDDGTSLGAALWIDAKLRANKQTIPSDLPTGRQDSKAIRTKQDSLNANQRLYNMDTVYLGPQFRDEEIEKFLKWIKVPYKKLTNVAKETAEIVAKDKIIGWYQRRMEFGPRALGDRSILASPIHADMQHQLNDIKDREDFRPVAPVVIEEEAHEWFRNAAYSPFMLFVYDVLPEKADSIPAVRHVDGTARIQTVNRKQNPLYYNLLREFKKITGVPILVNTSFNTRGEPIVCTPRDAVECFWTSPLDALVIGSFLLEK